MTFTITRKSKLIAYVVLNIVIVTIALAIPAYKRIEFNKICPPPRQAQNDNFNSEHFEDYILSIVFKDIQKGTYVDVGASNPEYSSLTTFFYNKGWRGINIEPIRKWYEKLKEVRPLDINLNIGISDKKGILEFYRIYLKDYPEMDGLSSLKKEFAEAANLRGIPYETLQIPVTTLEQVLEEHPLPEVNILKIDVEGFEKQAIEGMNWVKHRPEVLVIEAVLPFTLKASHHEWEQIILRNNYHFILSDGINRYYIDKKRRDRAKFFEKAAVCASMANNTFEVKKELDFHYNSLVN